MTILHLRNLVRGLGIGLMLLGHVPLAAAQAAAVSPHYKDLGFQSHGEVIVTADLGRATQSSEPIAVILAIDHTLSMASFIKSAAARALSIVEGIKQAYPNASFAVGWYADNIARPNEVAFEWGTNGFTSDAFEVRRALGSDRTADGGDWPEQVLHALDEAHHAHWPAGSRRVVLLIGDALGRTPDTSSVGQPLELSNIQKGFVKDSIVLFAAQVEHEPMMKETRKQFGALALATGGEMFPLSSADEIVDRLKEGLAKVLKPAPNIRVAVKFEEWVTPGIYGRIGSTNQFRTSVSLRVPDSASSGLFRIPLVTLSQTGDTLGVTYVDLRKGILFLPWRWPLLLGYLALIGLTLLLRMLSVLGALPPLFYGDHPARQLMGRLLLITLIVSGGIAIWKYAPGQNSLPIPVPAESLGSLATTSP